MQCLWLWLCHLSPRTYVLGWCNCLLGWIHIRKGNNVLVFSITLQWRHNGCDGISNYQPHDCLLYRLFRRRSKKISKLHVTGLCAGIHRWLVNSPHKWPVMRKMFPFDDVIMIFPHWDPSLRKIDTRLSRIVNVTECCSQFSYSDHYKILYMAWQLCCHGMYKHLLWSGRHQQNYSKAKFSSNLNCWQKNHKWKGRQGNVRLEEGNMHLQ